MSLTLILLLTLLFAPAENTNQTSDNHEPVALPTTVHNEFE